jgi:hemolysin activation/secretion protein
VLGKTSACALLAAILLLAPGIALAAPLSPADRNTIQQQLLLLDESQRQRESLERSVVVPRPVQPDSTATPQGPCFAISRIELTGANLLSPLAKERLVAPCLTGTSAGVISPAARF